MDRRHLHAIAALLLIFGGLAIIFTSTVEGAVAGLVATIIAGVVMIVARNRA